VIIVLELVHRYVQYELVHGLVHPQNDGDDYGIKTSIHVTGVIYLFLFPLISLTTRSHLLKRPLNAFCSVSQQSKVQRYEVTSYK